MGFTYNIPSDKDYWNHGYSSESDFIFITTNPMTYDALKALSAEVGVERFDGVLDFLLTLFIRLKSYPEEGSVCCRPVEWGKDDYSLNVQPFVDL